MWVDDFTTLPDFQEQLDTDFKNVFFNADAKEFAKEHDIDGEKIVVVIDNERLTQRQIKDDIENIAICNLLFFVEEKELGYRPEINRTINFDGVQHMIKDVREYMGALEIVLTSHISGGGWNG